MTKKCKDCYWYSQCGQEEPCEDYDPVNSELEETIKSEEYETILRERTEAYLKFANEQQK